jgi:hypothetical protein
MDVPADVAPLSPVKPAADIGAIGAHPPDQHSCRNKAEYERKEGWLADRADQRDDDQRQYQRSNRHQRLANDLARCRRPSNARRVRRPRRVQRAPATKAPSTSPSLFTVYPNHKPFDVV